MSKGEKENMTKKIKHKNVNKNKVNKRIRQKTKRKIKDKKDKKSSKEKSKVGSIVIKTFKELNAINIIVLVLCLIVILLIIKPFISTILLSIIFSMALLPIVKWLNKGIKNWKACSLIVVLIFVIIIIVVVGFLSSFIVSRFVEFYSKISVLNYKEVFSCNTKSASLNNLCIGFNNLITRYGWINIKELLMDITKKGIGIISSTLSSLPTLIIDAVILFFLMYYMLSKKDFIKLYIYKLPIDNKKLDFIVNKMKSSIIGVMYGNIIAAIVQTIVAGIGFFIFSVPNAIMWSLFIFPAAFIPIIGTSIVWLPASLYLIIKGIMIGSNNMIINGIILMVYCAVLVSNVDNIIKPLFISSKTKYNPIIILMTILGGLKLFGLGGVFIGPFLFIVCFEVIKIIVLEIKNQEQVSRASRYHK